MSFAGLKKQFNKANQVSSLLYIHRVHSIKERAKVEAYLLYVVEGNQCKMPTLQIVMMMLYTFMRETFNVIFLNARMRHVQGQIAVAMKALKL